MSLWLHSAYYKPTNFSEPVAKPSQMSQGGRSPTRLKICYHVRKFQ
jgi:hypothetical protein